MLAPAFVAPKEPGFAEVRALSGAAGNVYSDQVAQCHFGTKWPEIDPVYTCFYLVEAHVCKQFCLVHI